MKFFKTFLVLFIAAAVCVFCVEAGASTVLPWDEIANQARQKIRDHETQFGRIETVINRLNAAWATLDRTWRYEYQPLWNDLPENHPFEEFEYYDGHAPFYPSPLDADRPEDFISFQSVASVLTDILNEIDLLEQAILQQDITTIQAHLDVDYSDRVTAVLNPPSTAPGVSLQERVDQGTTFLSYLNDEINAMEKFFDDIDLIQTFANKLAAGNLNFDDKGGIDQDDITFAENMYALAFEYLACLDANVVNALNQDGIGSVNESDLAYVIAQIQAFMDTIQKIEDFAVKVEAGDYDFNNDGTIDIVDVTEAGQLYDFALMYSSHISSSARAKLSLDDADWGDSLTFDGRDDYVYCGNDLSLDMDGAMVITAWIKTSTSDVLQTIVSRIEMTSGDWNGYVFNVNKEGKLSLWTGWTGTPDSWITGNTQVNDGQWHHVAVSIAGGTSVTFYVDGKKDKNILGANRLISTGSQDFYIGAQYNDGAPFRVFDGSIGEVSIYNTSLSSLSIYDLFSGNDMLYQPTPIQPVSSWLFEEEGGTGVSDSAGVNDGEVHGYMPDYYVDEEDKNFVIKETGRAVIELGESKIEEYLNKLDFMEQIHIYSEIVLNVAILKYLYEVRLELNDPTLDEDYGDYMDDLYQGVSDTSLFMDRILEEIQILSDAIDARDYQTIWDHLEDIKDNSNRSVDNFISCLVDGVDVLHREIGDFRARLSELDALDGVDAQSQFITDCVLKTINLKEKHQNNLEEVKEKIKFIENRIGGSIYSLDYGYYLEELCKVAGWATVTKIDELDTIMEEWNYEETVNCPEEISAIQMLSDVLDGMILRSNTAAINGEGRDGVIEDINLYLADQADRYGVLQQHDVLRLKQEDSEIIGGTIQMGEEEPYQTL